MAASTVRSTTIKVSTTTRDRIRALGGETYEDTVVAALDALEADVFWSQVEAAAACRHAMDSDEQARSSAAETELERAFDGIA